MHDRGLPLSDRVGPLAPTTVVSPSHRPALVIGLANGSYFKAWCRRRGCVPVRSLSHALLFATDPATRSTG